MRKRAEEQNRPAESPKTGVSGTQAWTWGLLSLVVLILAAYTIVAGF